jgi:uncharacterized protein
VTTSTSQRLVLSLSRLLESTAPRERAALERALTLVNGASLSAETAFLLDPPETIFSGSELEVFDRLAHDDRAVVPTAHATTYMIMKSTRLCNLRCTYCHSWREGPNQIMPFEVLVRATRDVLRSTQTGSVNFIWHGGEATLLHLDFYKKALWLQYAFRSPSTRVSNSIQTNATNLSEEWIAFIKSCRINVGVSMDGPPEIHDRRRHDRAGGPTSGKVLCGISRLRLASIPFGVLLVITDEIIDYGPEHLLSYLVDIGVTNLAVLNVLPENADGPSKEDGNYLHWARFVAYLTDLFEVWWQRYRERLTIRELESLASSVKGSRQSICIYAGNCMGQFLTIEPNGDVSACDKYVGDPAYVFGNLYRDKLGSLLANSQNLRIVSSETAQRASKMAACENYNVCHGACPHDARLNERNIFNWNGDCCGLKPLINVIRTTVNSDATVTNAC